MTEEVEDELGTPLSRKNKWAIGMRACDSEAWLDLHFVSTCVTCFSMEASWDSGADMSVPRPGSEWLLLVAVGRGDMEGASRMRKGASRCGASQRAPTVQVWQKVESDDRSWYDYLLLL